MAAAAMLDSGYQAFFYSTHVLLFKVAISLPKVVKIDIKLREGHQFFLI